MICQKEYKLSQLIAEVNENSHEIDDFCLYTKEYVSTASESLIVYLEGYPTVTDDDEEEYPNFVAEHELFYYGDQFADVLSSLSEQKEDASIDEFIAALNHYLNNDAFITL